MMAAACLDDTSTTLRSEKSSALSAATHAAVSSPTPCTVKYFGGGAGAPPLPKPLPPSGRSITTPNCFSNFALYKKLCEETSGVRSTFVLTMLDSSTSSAFTPLFAATRAARRFFSPPAFTVLAVSSFAEIRCWIFSRSLFISSWNLQNDSHLCALESSFLFSASISFFASSENDSASVLHCLSSAICAMILLVSMIRGRGHFASRRDSSTWRMISCNWRCCSDASLRTWPALAVAPLSSGTAWISFMMTLSSSL
mmetsp:Transcript_81889/g.236734  ORF Transcript_81889/g.236734 Transcript_81889/m.236734 type:complete len:255 (-) Transcript_81889:307-1071(-)